MTSSRSHNAIAGGSQHRTLMQPLDRTAPKFTVFAGPKDLVTCSKDGSRHLYLIRWLGWEARCATPRGLLVKVLPVLDTINAGLEAILHPHGLSLQHALNRKTSISSGVSTDPSLPSAGLLEAAAGSGAAGCAETLGPDPFGEALKDLPSSWTIPWSVRRQRQGGTSTHVPANALVMTIDSEGSLDLDDAVSVVRLPNGNLQIGIHISDVSYFVEPGSKLNLLASHRATSIYLASGEILPMLPPRLANNLCSLLPNQERLCVSVSFEVTKSGRLVRDLGAARTIVRSQCRLTYAQADVLLAHGAAAAPVAGAFELPEELVDASGRAQEKQGTDPGKSPEWWQSLVDDLRVLATATGAMRSSRLAAGSIDFGELPLLKLSIQDNNVGLSEYNALGEQSRQLVSELMLLLNSWVAQVLVQHFPSSAPLRVQGAPSASRLANLVKWCDMHGIDAGTGDSLSIQRVVDASQQPGAPAKLLIAKTRCALAMSPARYACSGRLSEKSRRHFSLDLEGFTQFSSPIRRYLDIVVHRMLLEVVARSSAASSGTSGGSMHASLTPDYVQQLCEAADKSAARARTVQNLTWDLCLGKHLSATPRVLRAIVTQVSACYIKIYVPQLPYLPDSLRRIPVRALCPSSVSCEGNESALILSWGVKEGAGAAGGDSGSGLGGGGCWILGSPTGSVARAGPGHASKGASSQSQSIKGLDGAGAGSGSGPGGPPAEFISMWPGGGMTWEDCSPGHVTRRVQLFDWVSVQLVGHVDSRGLAGPKLEALTVGDFAIPFDHRVHPLARLVTAPPPSNPISCWPHPRPAATFVSPRQSLPGSLPAPDRSLATCVSAPGLAADESVGEAARKMPLAEVQLQAHMRSQMKALTAGLWSVVAHHMASAAAALPAEAVVRLVGVSIQGHRLQHRKARESCVAPCDVMDGWCSARFQVPLEAVAGLAGCPGGADMGTEEQQVRAAEALCDKSEHEPGLLCGMLCCVYAECAHLFSVMGGSQRESDERDETGSGSAGGGGSLPPVSPVSSCPSPISSQPSSGKHVATTMLPALQS